MPLLTCDKFRGKVDCTSKNQVVQANPDIAGIGVLVGFLSTTCLAFCVAFFVLFLDRYIAFEERRGRKKDEYRHDESGRHARWRSPEFWHKILSKNLLAFADTQLLTGLAVQFTAMLKHCELSVYHFRIVTELAFLTTVTHLLTVVVLRNYFVKNKWINLPRVFFMFGNLALLGYTSFVSYSYDIVGLDLSSSLACFFQGTRPPFHSAFGGKWAILLIGAIGGHAAVILAMYVLVDDREEDYIDEKWKVWVKVKRVGAIIRTWIIAPGYSIYGMYMAGEMFKYTQALGEPNVRMEGSENEWGFGQFLPVLLLALPIFAGWETFWEEKDPDRDNRFNRTSQGGLQSRSIFSFFDKERKSPARPKEPSPNTSLEERRLESNGSSPMGTPGQQNMPFLSTSTPQLTTPIPTNSLHLSVPSPAASPNLGSQGSPQTRPRSPSRFQEELR